MSGPREPVLESGPSEPALQGGPTEPLLQGGQEVGDPEEIDEANRAPAARSAAVLTYVARQIVEDPDSVQVEVSETRSGVRLDLHVAPGDMGKVIGRKGRIAQAIRAVVRAAASQEGVNVVVDIVD